jgi:LemA protein
MSFPNPSDPATGPGPSRHERGAARPWLIVLIVILVVLFASAASYTSRYNHMVALRENVKQHWAQVDVVIRRRADLIPNLVATVQGFAHHETKVIGEITKARAALGGAQTPGQEITANDALGGAVGRLLVDVENYPNLRSNRNFMALQDELAGTENRIAIERRKYDQAVQAYDTYVSTFPNNFIASASGMRYNQNYFHAVSAAQRKVPVVNFSH